MASVGYRRWGALAKLWLAVGSLSGCAGWPEDRPHPALLDVRELVPDTRPAPGRPAIWPRAAWWRRLQDPALQRLVEIALRDNPSLAAAEQRLQEAQAWAEMRAAALLPTVASGLSVDAVHFSKNSVALKLAGDTFALAMINPVILRYHIDLWGRDRAALEEALGLAQAEAAETRQARLLLAAAVARGYYRLRLVLAQGELADRIVETSAAKMRLLGVRLAAGLSARPLLLREQATLSEAEQRASATRLEALVLRHQLAALCGKGPGWGGALHWSGELPAEPPAVPDHLSIHLLAGRPDVAAARLRAEAAAKSVAVARAAFYPDVNIRGFAGLHSVNLVDVLFHGSSLAWAIGPTLELPIFEGGRLEANLKARQSAYDGAVASYNDVLVHALQQAADAVGRWDDVQARTSAQAEKVAASQENYRLQGGLAGTGISDRAALLETARDLDLQTFLLRGLEAERYRAWVDLVEALGGGLATADPPARQRG